MQIVYLVAYAVILLYALIRDIIDVSNYCDKTDEYLKNFCNTIYIWLAAYLLIAAIHFPISIYFIFVVTKHKKLLKRGGTQMGFVAQQPTAGAPQQQYAPPQ